MSPGLRCTVVCGYQRRSCLPSGLSIQVQARKLNYGAKNRICDTYVLITCACTRTHTGTRAAAVGNATLRKIRASHGCKL